MFNLKRQNDGPILRPDATQPWETEGVFNPGIARIGDTVYMLYRAVGEMEAYISHLGLATSTDGVHFTRVGNEPVFGPHHTYDKWATEDPRITKIEDEFFVTYVAVPKRIMEHGKSPNEIVPLVTATALLKTKDFLSFEELGVISPPGSDNKDIVLFPKKINGRYAMLHRPSHWIQKHAPFDIELFDTPHVPSIWIAFSDDCISWTDHKLFLTVTEKIDAKIGPGLPPIETKDGWLVIYHHVKEGTYPNKFVYSARAALFDLNDPTHLLAQLPYDILSPQEPYEKENNMPVIFPTGGFVEGDTLYVYYGASDRYVCLATGSIQELLNELKKFA